MIKKIAMKMDSEVWEEFKAVAAKYGLKVHALARILFQSVVDSEKRGLPSVTKNVMINMIKESKGITQQDKDLIVKELSEDL